MKPGAPLWQLMICARFFGLPFRKALFLLVAPHPTAEASQKE